MTQPPAALCALLQALSLPVTQLMTRATAEERAAFDADAANDAAFKAMIAEWGYDTALCELLGTSSACHMCIRLYAYCMSASIYVLQRVCITLHCPLPTASSALLPDCELLRVCRSSLPGIVQEMALCSERDGPLHFSYQDVGVPLRVYAGTADAIVPHAAIAEWVRRANASEASGSNSDAPRVQFVSVPGGTHDGLIHTHKGDALEALAADLVGPG